MQLTSVRTYHLQSYILNILSLLPKVRSILVPQHQYSSYRAIGLGKRILLYRIGGINHKLSNKISLNTNINKKRK